jgi:uncharacterized RmlC-like cupin family protein
MKLEIPERDGSEPTCRVVAPGTEFESKQGHLSARGITAESVGAQGIHLQIVSKAGGERLARH